MALECDVSLTDELVAEYCQFGCGNLKMVGPKKQDFCKEVIRFQGFHLIFEMEEHGASDASNYNWS